MVSTGGRSVPGLNGPITRVAARWKVTPSQVALAWLLARSPGMLPIPGTSKLDHLEENVSAANSEINENKMQEIVHL